MHSKIRLEACTVEKYIYENFENTLSVLLFFLKNYYSFVVNYSFFSFNGNIICIKFWTYACIHVQGSDKMFVTLNVENETYLYFISAVSAKI